MDFVSSKNPWISPCLFISTNTPCFKPPSSPRWTLFLAVLCGLWDLSSQCVCAWVLPSCPTLCDPMGCSLPGSSVRGILQARMLEWVAMPSSRGSSPPRDWTHISSPALGGGLFTTSAIWEAPHLGSFNRSLIVFPSSPSFSQGSQRGIIENSGRLRAILLLETCQSPHLTPHLWGWASMLPPWPAAPHPLQSPSMGWRLGTPLPTFTWLH